MKKNSIFSLILALAAGLTLATACDTSSEVTESDSARDCLITSATMGTLKRQVHTINAAGRDTTYTYTVTGAAYNLTIDQVNNRIFNEDSLPTGTRTDKLVFASSSGISSTGTLAIKSLYSGKDTLYTYTDSTDFSVKREVSVYDTYGERKRTYTFDIRVHRQEADSTAWQQVAANPLSDVASFVKSRALTTGNTLYVFGQRADGKVQVVQTSVMAPDFDGSAANISATGFDVRSVTHFGGHFYALANGTLMHSANAAEGWQTATTRHTFSAIAGCTADSIYAISNAQMWASANGTDWAPSAMTPTHSCLRATMWLRPRWPHALTNRPKCSSWWALKVARPMCGNTTSTRWAVSSHRGTACPKPASWALMPAPLCSSTHSLATTPTRCSPASVPKG